MTLSKGRRVTVRGALGYIEGVYRDMVSVRLDRGGVVLSGEHHVVPVERLDEHEVFEPLRRTVSG